MNLTHKFGLCFQSIPDKVLQAASDTLNHSPVQLNQPVTHPMKHIRKQREASAKRITQPAQPATPISDEVAAFYDSRRLTEEDIDHMAEV